MGKIKERTYKIYQHTNTKNGKIYIGVTVQTLTQRAGHDGIGYSNNKKLWDDIQRYGWQNFSHEIIDETEDRQRASRIEKELIISRKASVPEYGYNIQQWSNYDSARGIVPHVFAYDRQGAFVGEYESCRAAGQALDVGFKEVACVARGKLRSSKGYQFRYIFEPSVSPIRQRLASKVSQYDLDGDWIRTFADINEAAEVLGIVASYISTVCKGRHKTAKGFQFRYGDSRDNIGAISRPIPTEEDQRPVIQTTENGTFVREWSNIKEAMGAYSPTLLDVLRPHPKKTVLFGCKWHFKRGS